MVSNSDASPEPRITSGEPAKYAEANRYLDYLASGAQTLNYRRFAELLGYEPSNAYYKWMHLIDKILHWSDVQDRKRWLDGKTRRSAVIVLQAEKIPSIGFWNSVPDVTPSIEKHHEMLLELWAQVACPDVSDRERERIDILVRRHRSGRRTTQ